MPYPLKHLAEEAIHCMLTRQSVYLDESLQPGWERPRNFPLPIKRGEGNYRPMVIIEYVEETLAAADLAERMRAKNEQSIDTCGL